MRIKPMLAALAISSACLVLNLISPLNSDAEVNVNINIPLPNLVIPVPPAMIVIPGTNVYYPPDVDVDIFFYHGYWYRLYRGGWYTADEYNGPWRSIGPPRVPHVLNEMPHDYRHVPPGHERIPYGQVKKNWRNWENERHWDRRGERGGREDNGGREHGHAGGHDRGRHEDD